MEFSNMGERYGVCPLCLGVGTLNQHDCGSCLGTGFGVDPFNIIQPKKRIRPKQKGKEPKDFRYELAIRAFEDSLNHAHKKRR